MPGYNNSIFILVKTESFFNGYFSKNVQYNEIVCNFRGRRELKTSYLLIVFNFPVKLTFRPYTEVIYFIYIPGSTGDHI